MKAVLLCCLGVGLLSSVVMAGPEDDLKAFQEFYQQKFPEVPFEDYINGVYTINEDARAQWEMIEEFPPYTIAVEEGEELFNTPFANGKTYADCFPNGGIGIRQNYPYFDLESEQVKTLEMEINECREKNGEPPLPWQKGPLASISAYMAYTSRGKTIDIKVPDDPNALAAYERGKQSFYAKRGQLHFSCADCHILSPGLLLRSETLSPALGHTSHFPVYRSGWGELGTLHRRYIVCYRQVRAKPFAAQSEEYRNLEYFQTYMSNGLTINGPGSRK
ncbi:MAG: sulfur oxidation c-type cytochrome SoxA [Pseudomonadota bacterium]